MLPNATPTAHSFGYGHGDDSLLIVGGVEVERFVGHSDQAAYGGTG